MGGGHRVADTQPIGDKRSSRRPTCHLLDMCVQAAGTGQFPLADAEFVAD